MPFRDTDRIRARALLREALDDPGAEFREGQWEAIDALVNDRARLLVVERTGWGKSHVYFLATRLLRDRGAGPTLIVSPLLALMRNQVDAAARLGLRALTINTTNRSDWPALIDAIAAGQADALLISPERLGDAGFVEKVLRPVTPRLGLLVVDEAHCISDWGHDFRPDYRRLTSVLRTMPDTMPILGTTATASDRVVEDIRSQLGEVTIQRGKLSRRTLSLQTLRLPDRAHRLAWLAEHLPRLPGTGIVYTLTRRDADQVADWLNDNGIDARAYHSGLDQEGAGDPAAQRDHLESLLLGNRIKALVATTALGMGYDKPDLGFVVHYQAPGSIVAYYQQVGRAGRAIDQAFGVLLAGREDDEIHEFFRRSAFPPEEDVETLLAALAESGGLGTRQIEKAVNLRHGQIEKVLKFLTVEKPSPVVRQGAVWKRTAVPYEMDSARISRLVRQREHEWQAVQDYIDSPRCLMQVLAEALDDPLAERCGRCANCLGRPPVAETCDRSLVEAAERVLRRSELPFEARKQVAAGAFPEYRFQGNLPERLRADTGRILSRGRDTGWGVAVAEGRRRGHFGDDLVEAATEMIRRRWRPEPSPAWVTAVPSFRAPELVPDFARRLAERLELPFVAAVTRLRGNEPQSLQQNRFRKCRNLDGVFGIAGPVPKGAVLLVDDVVDSGWTLTVVAALLRRSGSGRVLPLALATGLGE